MADYPSPDMQLQVDAAANVAKAIIEVAIANEVPWAVPEMLAHAGFKLIEEAIGIDAMPERLRMVAEEIERQLADPAMMN